MDARAQDAPVSIARILEMAGALTVRQLTGGLKHATVSSIARYLEFTSSFESVRGRATDLSGEGNNVEI